MPTLDINKEWFLASLNGPGDRCITCWGDFEGNIVPIRLGCGHWMCKACIEQQVRIHSNTCPLCRQPFYDDPQRQARRVLEENAPVIDEDDQAALDAELAQFQADDDLAQLLLTIYKWGRKYLFVIVRFFASWLVFWKLLPKLWPTWDEGAWRVIAYILLWHSVLFCGFITLRWLYDAIDRYTIIGTEDEVLIDGYWAMSLLIVDNGVIALCYFVAYVFGVTNFAMAFGLAGVLAFWTASFLGYG